MLVLRPAFALWFHYSSITILLAWAFLRRLDFALPSGFEPCLLEKWTVIASKLEFIGVQLFLIGHSHFHFRLWAQTHACVRIAQRAISAWCWVEFVYITGSICSQIQRWHGSGFCCPHLFSLFHCCCWHDLYPTLNTGDSRALDWSEIYRGCAVRSRSMR